MSATAASGPAHLPHLPVAHRERVDVEPQGRPVRLVTATSDTALDVVERNAQDAAHEMEAQCASSIARYEALRDACYQAVFERPTLLGTDGLHLAVAFSNGGPQGIYSMVANDAGIVCCASCWTHQTGKGVAEFVTFTVPYSELQPVPTSSL